jgi:acyl-coenzyme A thioesterase PaaI-like protein
VSPEAGRSDGEAAVRSTPREQLAAATRDLLDAVLSLDADDAALESAAAATEQIVVDLRAAGLAAPGWASRDRERNHADYLPRSPLFGTVHPASGPWSWDIHDGRFVAHATLGAAFEGPPGYVHGGWVALMFDEALGVANVVGGNPGMTARLSVRYRRPTPLRTELRLEAWSTAREGRRITTVGTLHAGDTLCAEAEGLFIDIGAERQLEYFGERRATPDPVDPLP